MSQRYFAVTNPGLEQALLDELRTMRIKKPLLLEGGVEFQASNRGFYEANHRCRLASRVYLRVDEFQARDIHELFRKSRRFEWERLIPPGSPLLIEASTRRSRLKGTGEIARFVMDGITARFEKDLGLSAPFVQSKEEEKGRAGLRLMIRFDEDRCALNLDASGESLHRRGWREGAGKAPLRENIASALLSLLGWTPGVPLVDPMCGAGTFLIEAARLTLGLPPRLWEDYAFHRWANFQPELWAETIRPPAPDTGQAPASSDAILFSGFDHNAHVLQIATDNAAVAGVSALCSFEKQDVSRLELSDSAGGVVIANPPYGTRLPNEAEGSAGADRRLLRRFAEVGKGWSLGMLLPVESKPGQSGLIGIELARFRNGGIPVVFWKFAHK